MCYIEGGTPHGSTRAEPGCRDTSQPLDERAVFIPHQLYFSGRSRRWGGAPAFIDSVADESVQTYGRAWLITREQFIDVVRQENSDPELAIDLDQAIQDGQLSLRDRGYGLLLHLGDRDGAPMFTFTSPLPMAERRPAKPSMEYLETIVTGLRECYGLNVVGLRKYLNACPGVDHSLSHGQTEKLLHAAMVELGMIEDKPQKAQHKTGHPGKGGSSEINGGKRGIK